MEIWENLSERYLESMGVKPEPGLSRILNTMSTRQGTQYLIEHYGLQLEDVYKRQLSRRVHPPGGFL